MDYQTTFVFTPVYPSLPSGALRPFLLSIISTVVFALLFIALVCYSWMMYFRGVQRHGVALGPEEIEMGAVKPPPQQPDAVLGVHPEIRERIPQMTLEDDTPSLPYDMTECPYCCEEFVRGDSLTSLLGCRHTVHWTCLVGMMERGFHVCPCCRHHISFGDASTS